METTIQKHIIDFFSYVEEFYNKSKSCLRDCQNCAVSINKLIKRCKNIKRANVTGTALEEYAGVRNVLCSLLHNLISEDILEIRTLLSTIEEQFEKLIHKNKSFRDSCKEINLENKTSLINGTPLQPPLKQLLEFADDVVTFGSQICGQVNTALEVLTYKELEAEFFVDNFRISSDWQDRISEIIAYTSFLSENKV